MNMLLLIVLIFMSLGLVWVVNWRYDGMFVGFSWMWCVKLFVVFNGNIVKVNGIFLFLGICWRMLLIILWIVLLLFVLIKIFIGLFM